MTNIVADMRFAIHRRHLDRRAGADLFAKFAADTFVLVDSMGKHRLSGENLLDRAKRA